MSFCRGRLLFQTKPERRSQDVGLAQALNFEDSDLEDGDCDIKVCETPFASFNVGDGTPPRGDNSPSFWDSGLGSPTPRSSPYRTRRSPNSKVLSSPIHFNCDDSISDDDPIPPVPPSPSPPHKKLRSLRLYDTPHTPKSLVQRAQRRVVRINREKPYSGGSTGKQTKLDPDGPQINVNPFTPTPSMVPGMKRGRQTLDRSLVEDSIEADMEEDPPVNKSVTRLALHEINTSRYIEEFHEVCKLGDGAFGSVFKCINRLDGCTYAIKKSKMPVAGSVYERNALNEVYAHAVLGKHAQVVRYYSAWAENDHMYIQNEYCNGGCLSDAVAENAAQGECLSEPELLQLLLQLAQGLRYIHSQNLVHLDIKPGNVFLHRNPQQNSESGVEEDLLDDCEEEDTASEAIIYKIGDLGHVTSMSSPQVEEGDCRYLPREILQEDFKHLSKADIFSLALTVFEAGGGGELPKNGDTWHAIRQGHLPELPHYSAGLNDLLKSMVHPDPKARPSAATLVHNPVLCPMAKKSRAQLRRELNEEKFKNEILSRRLIEATQKKSEAEVEEDMLTALKPPKRHRLVGKKIGRSMSAVNF